MLTTCKKCEVEDREQLLKACNVSNLQPMWNEENDSKCNKMPNEFPIRVDMISNKDLINSNNPIEKVV